jgi:hypothetical protein
MKRPGSDLNRFVSLNLNQNLNRAAACAAKKS